MYIHKMDRNVYCPTEYGANIFGGKWKPRVLCLLSIKGTRRYKEIKSLTPDISDNVLSAVLKDLIAAQLVERKQYDEVPLRVEYSLTDKGMALIPVLHSICKWVAESYGAQAMGTADTCPYIALNKQTANITTFSDTNSL